MVRELKMASDRRKKALEAAEQRMLDAFERNGNEEQDTLNNGMETIEYI